MTKILSGYNILVKFDKQLQADKELIYETY